MLRVCIVLFSRIPWLQTASLHCTGLGRAPSLFFYVQAEKLAAQLLEEGREDAIFQQAQDVLVQVQENHRDILRIEASMRELHQIFAEMAVLVEEQGELMDDIMANVSKSVDYVQKGREELHQAKVNTKQGVRPNQHTLAAYCSVFGPSPSRHRIPV